MITDSFEIFCDKYHKRQHLSDDLIKYIMNINTLQIKEEHKEKHKQLFMNDFIRFMDVRLSNMKSNTEVWEDYNEIVLYLLNDRYDDRWTGEWMYQRWGLNLKAYVDDDGYLCDYLMDYHFDYSD
tara:strand:+ start:175 stop:549 length:375 start_codon:yes stop_codon:yes gene_type:complete